MLGADTSQDAVVIGGGFYGCAIAVYLAKQRGLKRIVLLEREPGLFKRASYNNQARVHNGYHYPRSFTTAYRSRVNSPNFLRDWHGVVRQDFTQLYAISRCNSKVTVAQFKRFCHEIGAEVQPAEPALRALFEPRLIEGVFLVEEYAFDAAQLANWAERELQACGVQVRFNTQVTSISNGPPLSVVAKSNSGDEELISSRHVINCTYSGLNHIGGDFPGTCTGLKHEITEMALISVPPELKQIGITVMDGPFFSMMPFPARELHTLSHVRYTPHLHWNDQQAINPYQKLQQYPCESRADRMLRDAERYLPAIRRAKYAGSLFEVKTVLQKNEIDDGRPILFERHPELPGCYSVLGGKIDNIYDVLEKLDLEFQHTQAL